MLWNKLCYKQLNKLISVKFRLIRNTNYSENWQNLWTICRTKTSAVTFGRWILTEFTKIYDYVLVSWVTGTLIYFCSCTSYGTEMSDSRGVSSWCNGESGIVVSEFELQVHYYDHFRTNTPGKGMNPLILPAIGWIVPLLFF